MKVYLLTQSLVSDWDTYDSVVVIAQNEEEARTIHPSEFVTHIKDGKWMGTYSRPEGGEYENESYDWVKFADIDKITVKEIGTANEDQTRGVLLASFNAG